MLGNRDCKQVITAVFGRQHYVALRNMMKNYPDFRENITRYIIGSGQYPYEIKVRTPLGLIMPRLFSHHDLLTVNEIFCRNDYLADENIRTVVDLGSNIGISALYFLTRNNESKCYLYEPDERNTGKLKKNLVGFEERYRLVQKAVSHDTGEVEFGVEPTGRYGGIGVKTGQTITVECLDINEVIGGVLEESRIIDILKIDTEGMEVTTVDAIDPKLLRKIRKVYLEAHPDRRLHPDLFWQTQYGSVCQLVNKALSNSLYRTR